MTRRVETSDAVMLATTSVGEGVPVVFSNSLAADQSMWAEVIDALEGRVQAITYDTVGHGASSFASHALNIDTLADHALAVARSYTDGPFIFCGLSLGGLTGMRLAAKEPAALLGLVLANTAPSFPPAEMWTDRAAAARVEGMAKLVAPTLDRWLTPSFQAATPDRTAQIEAMIAATPAAGYAQACEVLASADVAPGLANITSPTIAITGEHDPSTPPARAEEIAQAIPNAELRLLPAAHLSSVECPAAFADAILQLANRGAEKKVA